MNYQPIYNANFAPNESGEKLLQAYLQKMFAPKAIPGAPDDTWTDPTTNTMNAPGTLSAMQNAGAQSYIGMQYTAGTGAAPADSSY